jgi:putative phage-type endonuclease
MPEAGRLHQSAFQAEEEDGVTTSLAESSQKTWLDWRRTGIGASDAPVVAGLSPYKSRAELWLEKTRQVEPDTNMSHAMRWGHRLEPAIALALQERIGCTYSGEQVCLQSDERPWQLATLDRVIDDETIAEFKSVNPAKAATLGEDGDADSLPQEWLLQGQHQLAVSRRNVVIFAVFVGTLEDIRIYPVERNDQLIDSLNEVEAEFWESVQSKTPPPALDVRDSEALVKHLGVQEGRIELPAEIDAVVDEYDEIRRQIGLLEEMKGQSKAKIIDALGGVSSGLLPSGRIVKCSVSEVPGRTQVIKPHTRINLSFRNPKR